MAASELLRIYSPMECGEDGYPWAWHKSPREGQQAIKYHVREEAGHRCIRCGHPYPPGVAATNPHGEWTPCDEYCTHDGPVRPLAAWNPGRVNQEAQWRILTVHHLNGVKWDCRWWNLVALCQRCHLTIQGKVLMENVWGVEHSEWFKPYAAGWYAVRYLDEELSREEVMERLEELLSIELTQERLPGIP